MSRCYGDGGDDVATWLVCRVSVVPVEVLVMSISSDVPARLGPDTAA